MCVCMAVCPERGYALSVFFVPLQILYVGPHDTYISIDVYVFICVRIGCYGPPVSPVDRIAAEEDTDEEGADETDSFPLGIVGGSTTQRCHVARWRV